MKTPALALLAALASGIASASSIVPAQPTAFELVNLRLTTDSCAFNPSTVRVAAAGNVLKVTQRLNQCLQAGTPGTADVQLGSLAAGEYRVEVFAAENADGPPAETLQFRVMDPVEIAVFPPPPRPLTDYSGMWWNPMEGGWGISLHQGPTHVVFGTWFVYGADNQPEWYTFQGGRWTDSTTWTGTIYRTSGPALGGPAFDPHLVLVMPAGTATFEFRHHPGEEHRARFTYTLQGTTVAKAIERMRL